MNAMRAEPDGLNHLADRARSHELSGFHRRVILESFAVDDRINPLRLRLHPPHLGELLERRDAWLVDEKVLAVLHDANAERRTLHWDNRRKHECDGWILENLALVARHLHSRISRGELGEQLRLFDVDARELSTAAADRVHHPVDVRMVGADNGKAESRRRRCRHQDSAPKGKEAGTGLVILSILTAH